MKFHSTSRRDDLISLFYLLTFLLHQGNIPGIDLPTSLEHKSSGKQRECFERIKEAKSRLRSRDLCTGRSRKLKEFKKEIFSYHFKDEPRYGVLREMLNNLL